METDVVVASVHAIERIQAADGVVAFENANFLVVVGEPNARRQTRHASADDDGVVHVKRSLARWCNY